MYTGTAFLSRDIFPLILKIIAAPFEFCRQTQPSYFYKLC